jgi:hypothetical protein
MGPGTEQEELEIDPAMLEEMDKSQEEAQKRMEESWLRASEDWIFQED